MRWFALVFLLMAANSQAGFSDWDRERQAIFLSYNALVLADLAQTNSALKDPCNCYEEANPILGKNPDITKVIAMNLVTSYFIYEMLDKPQLSRADRNLLWGVTALRVGVVAHNRSLGVNMSWRF